MTAIDFSAFVNELATVSGETILPFFRTALSIEDKGRPGSFDPVTAADHAAETAMRTLIRRTFPDHGIIGEEYGKERADAEYVWVLDPIDGTKSFISGMPAWGTMIALLRSGQPVFGMMNQPFTRERFSGDGGRAHYRGPTGERDLRVRACADLAKAVLFTTSPLLMNTHDRETFGRVEAAVRLSRYGGDCYAYCMLAAGHVDLVIETELKPYDVLPLVPIITGAGGIITTWEGGAPRAGASSRPATSACTRRRWRCSGVGNQVVSRPIFTSAHLNNGVPGTKASNAAKVWMRKRSCSINSSWRAPGTTRCEPARSRSANSPIAGVDTMASMPAARIKIGCRMLAGKRSSEISLITRNAASAHPTVGEPTASAGSASSTATLRA